jgi:hypothetical protein
MNTRTTVLLTGFLMILSLHMYAQTYDFEDTVMPVLWQGNRADFQVSNTNQLQLNAPAGARASYLSWPGIQTQNCRWEFYVKYTFAASTTNYALFYLFSTEADLTSANNVSYYLKIGGVAGNTDKIELFYQQGSIKQLVLESRSGIVGGSQVNCRIQVFKNTAGIWELNVDAEGGFNFIKEASAKHWMPNPFNYSGLRCTYSSTRRDKFYFDDIKIQEPFAIERYVFENDSTLKIYFNKTIREKPEAGIILDVNESYAVAMLDNCMIVNFTESIRAGRYTILFSNFFSHNGDVLINTSLEIIKELEHYAGQLRISEWMSDPSPSYGLPEVEWVELINMSDEVIDLSKISISDPSAKVKLTAYSLHPDSVVIICSVNSCRHFSSKNCIEINALPNLNNNADSIFIWANDSLLIDFVEYNVSNMPADFRRDGGYSMVRKEYPGDCVFSQKIEFAQDNIGGSPGFILPVQKRSGLSIQATVLSASEICVDMNADISVWKDGFYTGMEILHKTNNQYRYGASYTYRLGQVLEDGSRYNFQIDSIFTCRNQVKHIGSEIEIIYPKQIHTNEVFINEVLYNPNSGGVDFIELYNSTSKYIQLQNSHFYNQTNTALQHVYIPGSIVIEPFGFVTLTSDTAILARQYSNMVRSNAFQLVRFLSLPDAGGTLIWLNNSGDTLDRVSYGDAYQNALHRDTEGYSLEKISSSVFGFYPANWTTSAVYATPGYVNSQQAQASGVHPKPFYCHPCHVTTNLNGVNDYALLHIGEMAQGDFGSISIYRLSGEKVVDLVVNQLLGSSNTFQWNGQQQGGGMLEDGIYVAVAEWWSPDGKTNVSKIAISTSQY